KPGRLETNDCIFERKIATEHLGKSDLKIDAQVVSGTGLAQIAVDDQGPHSFGLSEQPGEVQRSQGFAFADARAGNDERARLLVLTGLKDTRAQRTKLFAVSGA